MKSCRDTALMSSSKQVRELRKSTQMKTLAPFFLSRQRTRSDILWKSETMQGFAGSKFRVHDFLDSAKERNGLLLLNLPSLQCAGKCSQLLTHTLMFHHHSIQLALKGANKQFSLGILRKVPGIWNVVASDVLICVNFCCILSNTWQLLG